MHNSKKYKCVIFDYYGTLYNPLKDAFGAKHDLFYDHMPELIKFVSSRASCAIATRSPLLIVKEQLSEAGLWEFFSCVKSTEFGHDKPDPTILEYIMLELDVMALDCVMIGDSISDLAFAKNAGVDCIFVNFSDYKIDESFDAEVKSYTQAPIFNDVKLLQDYLDRRL